jgi:hypothetical protein
LRRRIASAPGADIGELTIGDRAGPILLIDARTRWAWSSRVEMRALRRSVDDSDLDRVATIAEACSS